MCVRDLCRGDVHAAGAKESESQLATTNAAPWRGGNFERKINAAPVSLFGRGVLPRANPMPKAIDVC